MIIITIPVCCKHELDYTIRTVFYEFLGLEYCIEYHCDELICISFSKSKKRLTLNCDFFIEAGKNWLCASSLPNLPLSVWNFSYSGLNPKLVNKSLPVLYGSEGLIFDESGISLNLDVFGSVFFMLSRYEEVVVADVDSHERFPAKSSFAYKGGFLERPIVDEYVELLWSCLEYLSPSLERKVKQFKPVISCDVDWPLDPRVYSFSKTLKSSLADILLRRELSKAITKISNFLCATFKLPFKDSYLETVYWIMDVNESVGNIVSFYFIPLKTSEYDSGTDFKSKEMVDLFKSIVTRGHEIGVHPGYNCYNNQGDFRNSVDYLKFLLDKLGCKMTKLGSRMHFLRWSSETTPALCEDNALYYDTSLGFADAAGFRCGTCHEFSMYDISNRKPLQVKQRPLINMESTVISSQYEGYGHTEQALKRFLKFKNIVRKFNGNYTLLWHNNNFQSKKDVDMYLKIISNDS